MFISVGVSMNNGICLFYFAFRKETSVFIDADSAYIKNIPIGFVRNGVFRTTKADIVI